MRNFESEAFKPYEPEEGSLTLYLEQLDLSRAKFLRFAEGLSHSQTQIQLEAVQKNGRAMIDSFTNAVSNIVNLDHVGHFEKKRMIQALHQNEDQKRVEGLNAILGEDILEPATFSSLSEAADFLIESGLKGQIPPMNDKKWIEAEARNFSSMLTVDLNTFSGHCSTGQLS